MVLLCTRSYAVPHSALHPLQAGFKLNALQGFNLCCIATSADHLNPSMEIAHHCLLDREPDMMHC